MRPPSRRSLPLATARDRVEPSRLLAGRNLASAGLRLMGRRKAERQRVVILGGGFAGLAAAKKLGADCYEVTLIDRRPSPYFNYVRVSTDVANWKLTTESEVGQIDPATPLTSSPISSTASAGSGFSRVRWTFGRAPTVPSGHKPTGYRGTRLISPRSNTTLRGSPSTQAPTDLRRASPLAATGRPFSSTIARTTCASTTTPRASTASEGGACNQTWIASTRPSPAVVQTPVVCRWIEWTDAP